MAKKLSIGIMNLHNELNVGGIIRTANAAGIEEVVIIGRKKWNKGAATGAHHKSKVTNIKTRKEFLDYCSKHKYDLLSLEISPNSENIFDYYYPDKSMLVVGNEGMGVPQQVISKSHSVIKIPQYGEMECLNVATAAGIAIYDWVRKNQTLPEQEIINSVYFRNK